MTDTCLICGSDGGRPALFTCTCENCEPDSTAWYCDHCGRYFSSDNGNRDCPCGARVGENADYATMPDGHQWSWLSFDNR